MTALSTSFVEFREIVTRHVTELEREYPERQGTTWYFLRYLQRVSRRAQAVESPVELESAVRALTRYYVDNIDEDSELAARFQDVLDAHRHALRSQHER